MNTSLNEKRNSKQRWPVFDEEQRAAVEQVLQSGKVNYWTGNKCTEFENKFKQKFKLRHTITVANGSVALDAAIKVLNLKKNDDALIELSKSKEKKLNIIKYIQKITAILTQVIFNHVQNFNLIDRYINTDENKNKNRFTVGEPKMIATGRKINK